MQASSFVLAVVFVNVMPAFWHAWDSTQGQPDSARVAAFKTEVIEPNRAVYDADEFTRDLASDATIAAYLDRLARHEAALRTLSDRASAELPSDLERIQYELPGLNLSDVSVYLLPSFNHFNGQTHDLGKGVGVLFGIDGLLEFDGPDVNLGVNVAHEFFHIFQYQTHPGFSSDAMNAWQAAWIEGSAAYASQQLASSATRAQALGTSLAATTPSDRKALACFLQAHWNSQEREDIDDLIDLGDHPEGLPSRGGYLIGYAAAQDFSRTHTLEQLGSAPMDQAEAALRSTVDRICSAA